MKINFMTATALTLTLSQISVAKQPSTIEQLELRAKNAIEVITSIQLSFSRGKAYDPCLLERLHIQKSYYEWFQEHAKDFEKIDQEITEKLKPIRKFVKKMNQEKTFLAGSEYSIQNLLHFHEIQKSKAQGIATTEITLFEAQLENSSTNEIPLTRTQARNGTEDLLRIYKTFIPARTSIRPDYTGYGLEILITTEISLIGRTFKITVPLVQSHDRVVITNESVWNYFGQQKEDFFGYPADGAARYIKMQNEKISAICKNNYSLPISNEKSLLIRHNFAIPEKASVGISAVSQTISEFLSYYKTVEIRILKEIGEDIASVRSPKSKDAGTFYNFLNANVASGTCVFFNLQSRSYLGDSIIAAEPTEEFGQLIFYSLNSKGKTSNKFKIACINIGKDFLSLDKALRAIGLALVI